MTLPEASELAQRWRRAKVIFEQVVALEAGRRSRVLDELVGDDNDLRAQVESLLDGDRVTAGVLDAPVFDQGIRVLAAQQKVEAEGLMLGAYRLLHRIGQGGMGEVYAAERADGQFEQRVAIKWVRRGFESPEVIERFLVERTILGRLDHPYIARIFDGGVSSDGRPYLVMEQVDGLPIDAYCRSESLSVDQRLRLIRRVASAVQYAHQNLVVHRDLKPSNILITGDGTPKLLDFGIAKLLASDAPASSAPTEKWSRRLTPNYASPEQVRGEAITTASDVYSLGVVLYELLADQRPYEVRGRPPRDVEQVVCEVVPPRPSLVAATPWRRRLRGDLDTIVLMALRKEPARRYASVDRLADDLRRYDEALPVLACDDTLFYRVSKLLRRHKVLAAFLVLIVGSGLAVAFQSVRLSASFARTTEALGVAEREGQRAEEVLRFLIGILKVADPRGDESEAVTVRQVLREGATRVRKELVNQPETQATLMDTIGQVYLQLGLLDDAEPLLQESLTARRDLLGEEHPDVATSLHNLGRLRRETGEWEIAESHARAALALRRTRLGDDHLQVAESLNSFGLALYSMGDYARAEPALTEALAIRTRQLGAPHRLVAESLNNLGLLHFRAGDLDAADRLLREAAAGYEVTLGADHPDLIAALHNLTMVIHRKGSPEEAEAVLQRVLALQRERLGPAHRDVADTLKNMGALLARRNAYDASETVLRQALTIHRNSLGPEHPDVADDLNDIGALLQAKGDLEAAEPWFVEALALRRDVLPDGHLSLAGSLVSLGSLYLDAGTPARAEPLLREGVVIRRRALATGHWRIAVAENVLGGALTRLGRREEAEAMLTGTCAIIEQRLGRDHRIARRARERLARFCEDASESSHGGPCADATSTR